MAPSRCFLWEHLQGLWAGTQRQWGWSVAELTQRPCILSVLSPWTMRAALLRDYRSLQGRAQGCGNSNPHGTNASTVCPLLNSLPSLMQKLQPSSFSPTISAPITSSLSGPTLSNLPEEEGIFLVGTGEPSFLVTLLCPSLWQAPSTNCREPSVHRGLLPSALASARNRPSCYLGDGISHWHLRGLRL